MELEKETTNAGNNTSKREGEAQEQRDSSAKRLKQCSIEADAFCCDVCSKPLTPPIFQCTEGHFCCSSCNDKLPTKEKTFFSKDHKEKKCTLGSGCTGTLARSLGVERAVRSILVDCRHAEHGCTEKVAYCDSVEHELRCRHEPWRCPEPGCLFAGRSEAELLGHFTGHHKWPSVTFRNWVPFDLRVAEPGTHVLRCEHDGELFLVSVQAAEPGGGLVVSLVSVRYVKPNEVGCSVSFSCHSLHHSTATQDGVRPWWHSGWPPMEHVCFVPKVVSDDGPDGDDAGVVLTININSVFDEVEESDDSTYDDYGDEYEDEDEDVNDSS
nr:unnamed protein product [Digitaria exilis]